MATTIGVKMQMDGAAQFKADLQQITQKSKELAAEMKAAAAGEDNLAEKQRIMGAQIDNARAKVDKLNEKYQAQERALRDTNEKLEEARKVYGDDSAEVQKLTLEVTKQGTALSKTKTEINKSTAELRSLETQTEDASKGMDKLGNETTETGNEVKNAEGKFSSVGSVIKKFGIAIGASVAAMGAALGAGLVNITKQAISAYSDFEQLEGGVQKLFGSDAEAVVQNATNAYKTAGLSMNDYMETVTGFSASLISSLKGDTKAATSYADQAIRDMSDNANTFGTDIGTIQSAYAGFAKGNFTMLDNLKLGYGGTKTEMERLIADANAVKAANGEMANLSIDSFADMVEAIHIMQEQMNIAGATEAEASKTIEGSVNSTKAAWQNFVTALGDSQADIKTAAKNLIDSATNVVRNVVPVIQNVVAAIPDAIDGIIQAINENDLLGTVIGAAQSIITGLIKALPAMLKSVIGAVVKTLPQVIKGIMAVLPDLIRTVVELFTALLQHISEIVQPIIDAIPDIVTAILTALPDLIRALLQAIPVIIDGLLGALPEIIQALIEALPQIVVAIVTELPKMAFEIAKAIILNFPQIIAGVVQGLASVLSTIGQWFGSLFSSLGEWFGGILKDVWNFVKSIPGKIAEGFSGIWEAGKNLVKGLWNGINDAAEWVLEKIKGFGKRILDGIKSFFGIESPSKEMAWVGKMLDEGLAKGISQYSGVAMSEAMNVADGISGAMSGLSAPSIGLAANGSLGAGGNAVTVNVYGAEGQNVNLLADIVIDKLQRTIIGSEAVYA